MKRPYQITAAILFLLSLFLVRESLRLKFYTPLGPGPGFFPFWLSLMLSVLSIAMFCQAAFRACGPMPSDFFDSRTGYLRALSICGAWIMATVLLEPLGYRLTMMLFFTVLLLSLGRVKWYTIILFSLLGSIGAYVLFTRVLSVVLPVGPFDGIFEPLDELLDGVLTVSR